MIHYKVCFGHSRHLSFFLSLFLFSTTLSATTQALSSDYLTQVKTVDLALKKKSDGSYETTTEAEDKLLKLHLGDHADAVLLERAKANEQVSEKIRRAVISARAKAERQRQQPYQSQLGDTSSFYRSPSLMQRLRASNAEFKSRL